MTETDYDHHVRIDWSGHMGTISRWDKVCIYAVENYGLPGGSYITDISENYMTWSFKNPKDALMFKLRWSEVTC